MAKQQEAAKDADQLNQNPPAPADTQPSPPPAPKETEPVNAAVAPPADNALSSTFKVTRATDTYVEAEVTVGDYDFGGRVLIDLNGKFSVDKGDTLTITISKA